MTRDLKSAAQAFRENPLNPDLLTEFLHSLESESSAATIARLLPLDYERLAGHLLLRLVEIIPHDPDLLLSTALWFYHFGADDQAWEYWRRAKELAPVALPVLQVEVYFRYGSSRAELLSLCQSAQRLYPEDPWIKQVMNCVENSPHLTHMTAPPLQSKWQQTLTGNITSGRL